MHILKLSNFIKKIIKRLTNKELELYCELKMEEETVKVSMVLEKE